VGSTSTARKWTIFRKVRGGNTGDEKTVCTSPVSLIDFVQPVERGKSLDLKTLEKRRQSITSHKIIRDGQEDESLITLV
jgi:hypothetical protein